MSGPSAVSLLGPVGISFHVSNGPQPLNDRLTVPENLAEEGLGVFPRCEVQLVHDAMIEIGQVRCLVVLYI